MSSETEYPPWMSVVSESMWRILDRRMGPILIVVACLALVDNFPSFKSYGGAPMIICGWIFAIPFVYLTDCKFKLLKFTVRGEEDAVKKLIASKSDLNRPSHNGETALSIAATVGHLEITRLLCTAGAHVDQGRGGDRPLLHAAEWGYTAIVQHLLSARASVNVANMAGETPLTKALQKDEVEVMQALCDARASVNVTNNTETPMRIAIRRRNLEAVKLLCIEGAERGEADQMAEASMLRDDAKGVSITDFLARTKGFSTRLHYAEHMNVKQVHSLLRQELPRSACTVPEVVKHPDSEACMELLRLWVWHPDSHAYFPVSHRRLVQRLLLVSKRLGIGRRSDADRCSLQMIFVAHAIPFVIDRTDHIEDFA